MDIKERIQLLEREMELLKEVDRLYDSTNEKKTAPHIPQFPPFPQPTWLPTEPWRFAGPIWVVDPNSQPFYTITSGYAEVKNP